MSRKPGLTGPGKEDTTDHHPIHPGAAIPATDPGGDEAAGTAAVVIVSAGTVAAATGATATRAAAIGAAATGGEGATSGETSATGGEAADPTTAGAR